MARAYIGVGSNIDPEMNIPRALRLLIEAVEVTGISTFYRTAALGDDRQPSFYNGVFAVETALPPRELKFCLLRPLEERLGRRRSEDRYLPRTIDLDLLLYDDLVLNEEDLVLPDPEIARRAFLAVPLCELAPEMILPGDGRAICAIAAQFHPRSMAALADFTAQLILKGTAHEQAARARTDT